jgi:2'-5' RNA ligase
MTEAARYALYLAPPPESALWRFGSEVIGRDAATGAEFSSFALDGFDAEAWRGMTVEPRRYGFHATIKAPFRLNETASEAALSEAAAELAAAQQAFDAGALRVSALPVGAAKAFVALTPAAPCAELSRLEGLVVRKLDRFRAPLTPAERARRNPDQLSARQREMLDSWGYPYALDEFRPHFTLSDALANSQPVADALAREFAARVASPRLRVDALALFAQSRSGGDFTILRRFPFQA